MSHTLTDILKALHLTKGNAIVDVTNGEVTAVYEKENKLTGYQERIVIHRNPDGSSPVVFK